MGGRFITVVGAVTGAAFSTLIAVYFHKYYKPKKYYKKIITDESHPISLKKQTHNTTKTLYMGPWGYSGDETSFNHNGYDGIKKIIIYYEKMINTIQIQYTKNGQDIWTPAVGRGLGSRTEIVLEDGEYITEVKGYHGPQPFLSINSLTFTTNMKNKFGPYGIDDKIPLEKKIPFQVKGGKVVGFHGKQFQNVLSAIGFYVETMEKLPKQTELMTSNGNDKADSITKVKYMGPWGYQGEGMIFNHNGYSGIKKVIIYYGTMIDSVVVQYTKNGQLVWTDKIGKKSSSDNHKEIVLEDSEHLVEVEGYCFRKTSNTIHSITFFTNLNRKFGPYGINNDIPSKFKTPFHVKGGKIVGFHWRTNLDDILYAVGFYVESVETSSTQIELVDSEAKEKMISKVGNTMEVIYVGPWGYLDEGKVFDHSGYNGIKKIIIYYGMMINSIQVQYIKDGKLTWTDEVSRNGIRKETLNMLSLVTRHSFRRSLYEVPSYHINGHLVLDEIDAESVGLMVSNRSSTPTSISDWHMVLDEIDTTHDNPPTRTLNNDDSLSEEIISKYLKPSRVMSSDKNVLCSICQESFEDDEKVGRLDCDHEFHFSCIKSWLIIQNKCPNCRASAVGL